MITKLSHATVYCDDHDTALEFYTNALGLVVRADESMGGFRWLTVSAPDQDLELVLMEVRPSDMMDEETTARLREVLHAGALGTGVFETDDCRATYEKLSAKGVEFISEPQERPYGVEAVFRDPSGNWFSLTERRG